MWPTWKRICRIYSRRQEPNSTNSRSTESAHCGRNVMKIYLTFLVECPALQNVHKRHMEFIVRTLKEDGASMSIGKYSWCYFILNCGAKHVCDVLTRGDRDTTIPNRRGACVFNCNSLKLGLSADHMSWELHNEHSKLLIQKAAPTHRRK